MHMQSHTVEVATDQGLYLRAGSRDLYIRLEPTRGSRWFSLDRTPKDGELQLGRLVVTWSRT